MYYFSYYFIQNKSQPNNDGTEVNVNNKTPWYESPQFQYVPPTFEMLPRKTPNKINPIDNSHYYDPWEDYELIGESNSNSNNNNNNDYQANVDNNITNNTENVTQHFSEHVHETRHDHVHNEQHNNSNITHQQHNNTFDTFNKSSPNKNYEYNHSQQFHNPTIPTNTPSSDNEIDHNIPIIYERNTTAPQYYRQNSRPDLNFSNNKANDNNSNVNESRNNAIIAQTHGKNQCDNNQTPVAEEHSGVIYNYSQNPVSIERIKKNNRC